MSNKINALPITLDREVKFYITETCNLIPRVTIHPSLDNLLNASYGTLAFTSLITYPVLERNVILTTDGSNVEFWDGFIVDERRPPLDSLRIDLHITFKELFMMARTPRMFVDLIMVGGNKIRVTITTPHDTVYNRIHCVD